MEEFEVKVLSTAHTPQIWLRFLMTLLSSRRQNTANNFFITSAHIQFTIEEPNQDGSLPFPDTKVTPGPKKTLITTVHRKPTHTDQDLHWDNNHSIAAKHSVYNTLAYRAKVVSNNPYTTLL